MAIGPETLQSLRRYWNKPVELRERRKRRRKERKRRKNRGMEWREQS